MYVLWQDVLADLTMTDEIGFIGAPRLSVLLTVARLLCELIYLPWMGAAILVVASPPKHWLDLLWSRHGLQTGDGAWVPFLLAESILVWSLLGL